MATAKRAKVVQTTKPSISDPKSNRQTGGDMTQVTGSPRSHTGFKHGATPGTPTRNGQFASGNMVDQQNEKFKPNVGKRKG